MGIAAPDGRYTVGQAIEDWLRDGVLTRPSRMGSVMPVRLCGARLAIFCPNGSWFPGPYMYRPPLTA